MKLERINENQIRCTLTSSDLASRKINLSELTYGSEKARNLFHDMMLQAKHELGFEANGMPLMIEAIPLADSLVLNITRVSEPEELDTRFSSFSTPGSKTTPEVHLSGADGILNLIKKATEAALDNRKKEGEKKPSGTASSSGGTPSAKESAEPNAPLIEAFRFSSLDDAILGAKAVSSDFNAKNSLYKYDSNTYILLIHSANADPELFNKTCNILSEYSVSDHVSEASESYLREHGYLMIADTAIQKLAHI